MTVFASITPAQKADGVIYSSSAPIPAGEGDLYNGPTGPATYDPPSCGFSQAITAVVQLAVTGNPTSNSTYVVLQTDMGDGIWIDLAWLTWSAVTGSGIWVLAAGNNGAIAFQNSRAAGTAPSGTSSQKCGLGGRFRFVGKSTLGTSSGSPSSSPAAGSGAQVLATIKYRLYDFGGST